MVKNQPESDFEFTFPSYELGNGQLPEEFARAVNLIDKELLTPIVFKAYIDDSNCEIRFFSPNEIGIPNNLTSLLKTLRDVREYKKLVFKRVGIRDDEIIYQLVFIILHELKHFSQLREGRLKPWLPEDESDILENEADEYAIEIIQEMLGSR